MRRTFLMALLLGSALATQAAGPLQVVATYALWGEVALEVGGEGVAVTSLVPGDRDPHYAEARPSYLAALHRADALVLNGLDLEVGFLPPLLERSGNARIQPGTPGYVDCSTFVEALRTASADRSLGDVHPHGNPHYHLDPGNMARVARGLAEALGALDPAGAEGYRRRGEAAAARYLSLEADLDRILAPARGTPLVTYHATFDYFLRRYGFVQTGFVEPKPGVRPGPKSLAVLEGAMRREGVRIILTEPYMDLKVAERVARDTGARVVTVPTYAGAAGAYASMMRDLARAVCDARGR